MPDITARLDLPLIQPSQAQKHVTHNEALQVLDGLVQAALEETGATTPPFEPVTGTLYALGPNPTGDWADDANKLALRITEAWLFIEPQTGWRAWDKATGRFVVFDGTGWAEIRPDLDNLDGIGIGTTSDANNRLAVASAASLFTHAGNGHQIKVNKYAPADTASLLFQSNWTGHAEMGLAGDTAFSIKLSDDGTTWHDALRADPATQQLDTDFQITGDAVQQSPTDTTAGRLMRADYGYSPGNLLGTVSQSGGIPTGAVVERGSNANGEYVRLADGTQICAQSLALGSIVAQGSGTFASPYTSNVSNWSFPPSLLPIQKSSLPSAALPRRHPRRAAPSAGRSATSIRRRRFRCRQRVSAATPRPTMPRRPWLQSANGSEGENIMILNLVPMRRNTALTVSRAGDVLTINSKVFDFSGIPEGASLPRQAIASDWIAGDVERDDQGQLTVPLILPHGPNAPESTRFPAPVTLTADGPVDLPPHTSEQTA